MIQFFARKGFLLDLDMLHFFNELNDLEFSNNLVNKISNITKQRLITKSLIKNHFKDLKIFFDTLDTEKESYVNSFFEYSIKALENKQEIKKPIVCRRTDNFKILSSNIIPDKKIEVKDFNKHFRNRYNFFKELLKEKKELDKLISIDKIGNTREFSIIGMVLDKKITKNKNIILEIEDLTGKISVLINSNKPEIFSKAKEIVYDDVIGLNCSGNSNLAFVNDIIFLDSFIMQKIKSKEESYAVFISDIHIGSKNFLESNFQRFLDWISCKICDKEQEEKIKKIKYLFIVGDTVDGVGVYPGQEESLLIKDLKQQYKKLAEFLSQVPKHINIFLCPGQHDASRVPEPQPPIDPEYAEPLIQLENLFLVPNPTLIEIELNKKDNSGIKILMYHGASMHSWIDQIDDLRTGKANLNPAKVIKYILRHRHLSPTHSGNVYIPSDKFDSLIIDKVPDIILTGDMHRTDVDMYNNTLIICSSCWQSITAFEEKVGNQPDPCKVPFLNLKTRELKILDFS